MRPSPPARLLVIALAAVPWLMVAVQWLVILPRFDRLFRQFDMPAPAVLDVFHWVKGHVFVAGCVFLFCVMLSLLGVWRLMNRDMPAWSRNWRLLAVFAVPLVLFFLAWVGVAGPDSRLRDALGR